MRDPRYDVLFEPVVLDLTFQVGSQLAFSRDDETGVRYLSDDQRRCLDQISLTLVRHERGDVPDDRRLVRQPEFLVQPCGWSRRDTVQIHTFVYRDRSCRRNAVRDQ